MNAAHILVVDDDAAIRAMLRALFEAEGYRVTAAADGAAAVAVTGPSQPDLILLDVQMPGANGGDVARALRRQGCRAPIVLMSASDALRREARASEADAWLAKPFDIDALLDCVARLVRRAASSGLLSAGAGGCSTAAHRSPFA